MSDDELDEIRQAAAEVKRLDNELEVLMAAVPVIRRRRRKAKDRLHELAVETVSKGHKVSEVSAAANMLPGTLRYLRGEQKKSQDGTTGKETE